MNDTTITGLPSRNTWVLVLLSIFTYFVYPAHYVWKLSDKLNEADSDGPRISEGLAWSVFITSYLSLVFFLGTVVLADNLLLVVLSKVTDLTNGILFLVWAFSARARLNFLTHATQGTTHWVRGFSTFLLTIFYVNYKVAKLKREAANRPTPPLLAS